MKTKIQAERAMRAAGINGEITGGTNSTSWQVEFEAEVEMWRFRIEVALIGGFKTGHGTWILATCCKPIDLRDRSQFFTKEFVSSLPNDRSADDWANRLTPQQMSRIYDVLDGPIPEYLKNVSDDELLAGLRGN